MRTEMHSIFKSKLQRWVKLTMLLSSTGWLGDLLINVRSFLSTASTLGFVLCWALFPEGSVFQIAQSMS